MCEPLRISDSLYIIMFWCRPSILPSLRLLLFANFSMNMHSNLFSVMHIFIFLDVQYAIMFFSCDAFGLLIFHLKENHQVELRLL
ncbi:hypothetical protein ACQJBY_029168 [Aegilops geniculata]